MVINAAKNSAAWTVGPRLCSAGFIKSVERGELPQMVLSIEHRVARVSGKLARKKTLPSATPYATPPGQETTDTRVATEEGRVTTDGEYVE